MRAGRLEVVELLRVDVREAPRLPGLGEEARRERGTLRPVVPAAEGPDQHGMAKGRTPLDAEVAADGRSLRQYGPRPEEKAGSERDDPDPDGRRQGDVREHEGPGQVLSPLNVSDRHLDEQEPEHSRSEEEVAARLVPSPEERGDDADEGDAEDGRGSDVYVQRVGKQPVALDLVPPECGPAAVTRVPVAMSAAALGTSTTASQLAASGGCVVAPRAKSRAPTATTTAAARASSESRKCAMTMSGWSSKITVIPPRIPCASTVTGSAHAAQRSQRGSRSTRVAAIAAASVTSPTTKPTPRFPYSTSAWKFFSGRKEEPQRGQLSHPSPEPVRRTVAPETTMRKSAPSAR